MTIDPATGKPLPEPRELRNPAAATKFLQSRRDLHDKRTGTYIVHNTK